MTDREQLLAAILTSTPHDCWDAMQVYADWLDERGQPEATGWRLLADLKAWPRLAENGYTWRGVHPFLYGYYATLRTALVSGAASLTDHYAAGWRPTQESTP